MPTLATWMPHALALTLVLASNAASAAESSAAAASALKVLLGPAAVMQASASGRVMAEGLDRVLPTPASAGVAMSASGQGARVTVQRGETLDRVIRRTLPHVPLQIDFLRKAFVSLNPQAFPTGSVHLMRAGSTLQVPSMAALRQMVVQQNPQSAAFFEPETPAPGAYNADKRRWVRFP